MIRITRYGEVTRFDLSRTLFGKGRYWTSAYLADGWMIDTGCAYSAAELAQALGDCRLRGIVNTHSHEDHIGGNGRLQRTHGGAAELPILAHSLALPVLADPRRKQPLHPYRRVFWGLPEPCQATALTDGQVIEGERCHFQVIFTPGHSPDHLCLFELSHGWLFSGDLFVGGRDRALRAGQDIWQTIQSLKRIAALPAEVLFPGSARVRERPAQELQQRIAYLEELGEKVLALHAAGLGVGEIVRRLCGAPMWIELVTLGHFSRRQLVLSYLSGRGARG